MESSRGRIFAKIVDGSRKAAAQVTSRWRRFGVRWIPFFTRDTLPDHFDPQA